MADSSDRSSDSSLLLSAVTGAVLGAAGLAWWLLSEADRRRRDDRQHRLLRLSRFQGGPAEESAAARPEIGDADLRNRVQQLNQAIDEVRRQLEELQPQP
jgi:uncharacterized protein YceH (UPF0502 family)